MVKQESVDKVGRIMHVPQPHTPVLWLFHRGGKGGKVRMYFGSGISRLPDELGIKGKANKGIKDYF